MSKLKPEDFRVTRSTPEMADRLAQIQRTCFPYLSEEELITAEQYSAHMKVFPEGQLAVIGPDGIPVASSTDFRCHMDFNNYQHKFIEATGYNWLTTHKPDGEWLYGVDIGVLPDYRGYGLGRMLYDSRKQVIRDLNLRGHVAGGLLKGYGAIKHEMSAQEYLDRVTSGDIFDPTLSIQMKCGFNIVGLIDEYLEDSSCDNKAALIVWRNPDYKESN